MDIAIITGASSGLGIEFFNAVCDLCPETDEIWLVARRKEKLEELAKQTNLKVRAVSLDLTVSDSVSQLESMLDAENVNVKILINNAGFGKLGYVNEIPYDQQIQMVALNNGALTALCSMCINFMRAGSFIINVASIAAFAPNPRMSTYCSTKAYVLSFTKSIREELKKKKINALAVCPGPMATEFLDVAGISGGKSKTFETLPYCDPKKTAYNAVRSAKKGKAIYTPKAFYKFYRVLAKLAPHNIIMKFSKT